MACVSLGSKLMDLLFGTVRVDDVRVIDVTVLRRARASGVETVKLVSV